jgi:hypothetical protein
MPATPRQQQATTEPGRASAEASASAISTYDFTSMTPKEMQGVAARLHQSGAIDLTQFFMLENAGVPLGKVGANGEFVPLSAAEREGFRNTPTDFIQIARNALAGIESQGRAADPTSGYQGWKDILALLQNRQGQASSIDLRA